ncbi:transposable element Tcb1 transposase [Trichonephila clavipes]|nr:transposable element Tcb1 transposase [Trichonephila clavipes]
MWAAEWNEVVFTDESRICLQHHDGRIRVWRHRGEWRLNSCVMHRHTGSAPGIMRSAFDQVSEFDRGRIVAYRDCGLSFREIGSRVGRNQTTVMRICDSRMQEGTMDRRGRSHPPHCTTSREDRQIVSMAVTDLSVTSRTIAQQIECVTHHSVSARSIRRLLQQSAERSVCKTSIAWSTLDAEPQMSPLPMVR